MSCSFKRKSDASIANATFAALDGYIPASGATVLTCADLSVLAQAQAGLNASLASVGISVEIDGNSLVAESHYTFNSSVVSDMNDATGWVNGLAAPAGQPAIIAGSTTEAVMDNAVPDYASIDVTDGATLTVAATRDFPELMLSAGTKLKVSPMSGTLLQSYDTCIPHSSAVVVGTMDPSASMTSLSVLEFARLTKDIIPAGVFQVITGSGREAGQAVLEHPDLSSLLAAAGPILYAGILSSGAGYTLQILGQKYADPSVASILMSLESVFSVLAGFLFLHQAMSAKELAGCALMFGAIVLAQIPEKKTAESSAVRSRTESEHQE